MTVIMELKMCDDDRELIGREVLALQDLRQGLRNIEVTLTTMADRLESIALRIGDKVDRGPVY